MFFAGVVGTRETIGFKKLGKQHRAAGKNGKEGKVRRNAVDRARMKGGGETYSTTAFFISDQGATNLLTTTRTVLEHLQHLQDTPGWDEQQALEDSWGSLPAGGTANS